MDSCWESVRNRPMKTSEPNANRFLKSYDASYLHGKASPTAHRFILKPSGPWPLLELSVIWHGLLHFPGWGRSCDRTESSSLTLSSKHYFVLFRSQSDLPTWSHPDSSYVCRLVDPQRSRFSLVLCVSFWNCQPTIMINVLICDWQWKKSRFCFFKTEFLWSSVGLWLYDVCFK